MEGAKDEQIEDFIRHQLATSSVFYIVSVVSRLLTVLLLFHLRNLWSLVVLV